MSVGLSIENVARIRRDKTYPDNELLQYWLSGPPVLPAGRTPRVATMIIIPPPAVIKRFLPRKVLDFNIDICRDPGKL